MISLVPSLGLVLEETGRNRSLLHIFHILQDFYRPLCSPPPPSVVSFPSCCCSAGFSCAVGYSARGTRAPGWVCSPLTCASGRAAEQSSSAPTEMSPRSPRSRQGIILAAVPRQRRCQARRSGCSSGEGLSMPVPERLVWRGRSARDKRLVTVHSADLSDRSD